MMTEDEMRSLMIDHVQEMVYLNHGECPDTGVMYDIDWFSSFDAIMFDDNATDDIRVKFFLQGRETNVTPHEFLSELYED